MGEAQDRAERAYNAAADWYDAEPLAFWEYFGRRTAERLPLQDGAKVLDVCCGSGASAIPAAQRVGQSGQVIGVDLAEQLLELGRRKAAARSLGNVRFERGDMLDLPFPEESFDAVICVFGIFFVPDMSVATKELWQRVRRGGHLAITTWGERLFEPGNAAFWRAIREVRPDLYKGFNPWDRIDNEAALRAMLRDAGLGDVEIESEQRVQQLRSPNDWWTIVLGSGYRGTIEQLSATERETVKTKNVDALRAAGVSAVETNALYAIARKAA